ncbi:hypothetical protein C7271_12095 [filamentous cyanobacterium CCP5]|nr:hypothetical protein C7271_12095 [filamentous cyanobacterium CCP5]
MTTASTTPAAVTQPLGVKKVFLVVGIVCIVGFFIDMLVLAIPPAPMALEWRFGFMQQLSDRAIILFLGAALVLYALPGSGMLGRYLAMGCLIAGIFFPLSCVLVVRDNLVAQGQALTNIGDQAQQLQTQVEAARSSPDLPEEITLEQLQDASLQIDTQAEALTQNTRTSISKSILSSAGRLIVFGVGFLGLGRYGISRKNS